MANTSDQATRAIKDDVPSLRWERRAWQAGKLVVAGVDEVGRGAWAGPLVAAAVALPCDSRSRGQLTRAVNREAVVVRDSKLMSAEQRRRVLDVLSAHGVARAVSVVAVEELDAIGLAAANRAALCRAARALSPEPEHVLVDAFALDDLDCTHEAIIRGDCLSQSIALASIVAKLHRDQIMETLGEEAPEYGFAAHKGYGTVAHQAALRRHGVSAHHRRSFGPIANLLIHAAHDG
ncbi:MAG: ribonuclease HII [Vicinamibacterales bacterium]